MQLLARTPTSLTSYSFHPSNSLEVARSHDGVRSVVMSGDGENILLVSEDKVELIQSSTKVSLGVIPEPGVLLASFSPAGGYVVTAQRPSKSGDQPAKNVKVWSVSGCQAVLQLSAKQVSKDMWPLLQFTNDDSQLFNMVTNTLHVYSKFDNFATYRKITVKGISSFSVCPGPQPLLVAFTPEAKGSPASALLLNHSQAEPQPLVKRSFFRCQGVKLLWNKPGTAVLALAFADYDVTNQSYYGEQKLHFIPTSPAKFDLAGQVALPKEGPVHDVQWSPDGQHFCVVAGFMPAKVTLFDVNAKPVFDLGGGPFSLVRWNPFGRFMAVMGFGNLPGDIVFYDKKASGSCKQIAAIRSPAVTAEWAPDGRHFMVATVAPRLRVDNNLRVFTYYGEQVLEQKFDTLFEAAWVPAPAGTYEDQPQSPERLAASTSGSGAATTGLAKRAGYVPPHLRGAGGAAAAVPSATFSLAYDDDSKPKGRLRGSLPGASNAGPPGSEFISEAAKKNAKKRASKKKSEGDADGTSSTTSAVTEVTEAAASMNLEDSEEAKAKRVRNLQKKLRQVQQLKEKQAQGSVLEPEQLQKITTEAALVEEITSLGGSV